MQMEMELQIHGTLEIAIYSAANYLSKSGRRKVSIKGNGFSYNHSEKYVEDVLYYGNFIRRNSKKNIK